MGREVRSTENLKFRTDLRARVVDVGQQHNITEDDDFQSYIAQNLWIESRSSPCQCRSLHSLQTSLPAVETWWSEVDAALWVVVSTIDAHFSILFWSVALKIDCAGELFSFHEFFEIVQGKFWSTSQSACHTVKLTSKTNLCIYLIQFMYLYWCALNW